MRWLLVTAATARRLRHAADRAACISAIWSARCRTGSSCSAQYDCFYFVADWHALTSDYANTGPIVENALDNVADWIGAGIDPEKSTLFVQSLVPEHAELYLLLQMITPIPWLERVPTYKEQMEQLAEQGPVEPRLSRLSAAADGRRHHLQRALRAGRRRSGAAPRALARGRAALPQLLRRGLRRAAAAADADAPAAGPRQPQDEQELRQHDRPVGHAPTTS